MINIYWSNTHYISPSDIRSLAKCVTINPLPPIYNRENFTLIKAQLNADTFENNIGWNYTIALIVSADQLPENAKYQSTTKTIETWMYEWEDAKFRWIEDAEFNSGLPLRVGFLAKPVRTRVDGEADLPEFQYALIGKEFNFIDG